MGADQKRANAIGLYMTAIRDGEAEKALNTYLGDRYTQHSTGVADGKAGFLDFFVPFLERNPDRDMRVVRTIVDGPYVALHVHQILNHGQFRYVTSDMFDTDAQDKIIEHWDVIQEEVMKTCSGRSMIEGPSEITDLDKTEANRALITAFFEVFMIGGDFDRLSAFISSDHYAQHSPGLGDGIVAMADFVDANIKAGEIARYVKAHKILVEGNFSCVMSEVRSSTDAWCVMDWFRIENGKIVEHWDVREKILPEDQWNNSGKF